MASVAPLFRVSVPSPSLLGGRVGTVEAVGKGDRLAVGIDVVGLVGVGREATGIIDGIGCRVLEECRP